MKQNKMTIHTKILQTLAECEKGPTNFSLYIPLIASCLSSDVGTNGVEVACFQREQMKSELLTD